MYVGTVHTAAAAAAKLVAWGYEVHPAQQTHNQDHDTERVIESLHHVHHEGRALEKAKIVDNESMDGDSSDGVEPVDSTDYLEQNPSRPASVIWYE